MWKKKFSFGPLSLTPPPPPPLGTGYCGRQVLILPDHSSSPIDRHKLLSITKQTKSCCSYIYILLHMPRRLPESWLGWLRCKERKSIPLLLFLKFYNSHEKRSAPGWHFLGGGRHLKPPKIEHIFVAVITFAPFLLCKYFWYQLVAYSVCFKMICKKSL